MSKSPATTAPRLRCSQWGCRNAATYLRTAPFRLRVLCGVHIRSDRKYNPGAVGPIGPDLYPMLLAEQAANDAEVARVEAERMVAFRAEQARVREKSRQQAIAREATDWTWTRDVVTSFGSEHVVYRVHAIAGDAMDARITITPPRDGFPAEVSSPGSSGWPASFTIVMAEALAAAAAEARRMTAEASTK